MIRTAVDTSVLLDVFAADPKHGKASMVALEKAWNEGIVVACEVVWAEIRPRFDSDEALLAVTTKMGLGYESLERDSALLAGALWKRYRSDGGSKQRVIPDFLIGAHAQLYADRFLTRDRGFYRKYFSKITLFEP